MGARPVSGYVQGLIPVADMDRRQFAKLCAGAACAHSLGAWAASVQAYRPSALVDEGGQPLKASAVPVDEAMVFAYPYQGVPCYLINLGRPAAQPVALTAPDGSSYQSPNGVGPGQRLVAFVAICTHQLTYPTPRISLLRYAPSGSEISQKPNRIVCCAHGSVFDPSQGARQVAGPAPTALLPVMLEHDPETDQLTATGTVGEEFFQRFFKAYKGDLIDRFGPGGYRQPVSEQTRAVLLSRFSAQVPAC